MRRELAFHITIRRGVWSPESWAPGPRLSLMQEGQVVDCILPFSPGCILNVRYALETVIPSHTGGWRNEFDLLIRHEWGPATSAIWLLYPNVVVRRTRDATGAFGVFVLPTQPTGAIEDETATLLQQTHLKNNQYNIPGTTEMRIERATNRVTISELARFDPISNTKGMTHDGVVLIGQLDIPRDESDLVSSEDLGVIEELRHCLLAYSLPRDLERGDTIWVRFSLNPRESAHATHNRDPIWWLRRSVEVAGDIVCPNEVRRLFVQRLEGLYDDLVAGIRVRDLTLGHVSALRDRVHQRWFPRPTSTRVRDWRICFLPEFHRKRLEVRQCAVDPGRPHLVAPHPNPDHALRGRKRQLLYQWDGGYLHFPMKDATRCARGIYNHLRQYARGEDNAKTKEDIGTATKVAHDDASAIVDALAEQGAITASADRARFFVGCDNAEPRYHELPLDFHSLREHSYPGFRLPLHLVWHNPLWLLVPWLALLFASLAFLGLRLQDILSFIRHLFR